MNWSVDGRVPVVFGKIADARVDDAFLVEGDAEVPSGHPVARFIDLASHQASCACCWGRGAAATALGNIFLARARGETAYFRRVLAVVADVEATRAALARDPLVLGRFVVN